MLFSIAVPVLGQAGFISTALASIKAQGCRHELAVMDASPDRSVQEILDHYPGILHYRRHGPDAGQAAAIQEGWDRTSGDVVAWLCADDYYFPGALDAVATVFEANPEIDVVYGDSVFVNRDGNFLGYFPEIRDVDESLFYNCCISQPSCFVRRSALARAGKLNSDLHYVMDWDFWVRLYKTGARFYYLKQPLSAVRIYDETKTSSRSARRYKEINDLLKANTSFFRRCKSLLGFLHYDLLNCKRSMTDEVMLTLLNGGKSAMRYFSGKSNADRKSLYGIEPYTGRVVGECDVFLPYYGTQDPQCIKVTCRNVLSIQANVNGTSAMSSISFQESDRVEFLVQAENIAKTNLIHLKLKSESSAPWKLSSVYLS